MSSMNVRNCVNSRNIATAFTLTCHPPVWKYVLGWGGRSQGRGGQTCCMESIIPGGRLWPLGASSFRFRPASTNIFLVCLPLWHFNLSLVFFLGDVEGGSWSPLCVDHITLWPVQFQRGTACVLCDNSVLTTPTYSQCEWDYLSNILGQLDPASSSYWLT